MDLIEIEKMIAEATVKLRAENARLREELDCTKDILEQTREELAAAQKDVERYRWLRIQDRDDLSFAVLESAHWRGAGDCDPYFFDNSEELDAAIDEAIEQENEK